MRCAGTDKKGSARANRGLAHGGIQHGARANDRACDFVADGADGSERAGRSQGDFNDRQAARHKRARLRHAVLHALHCEHGDHGRA